MNIRKIVKRKKVDLEIFLEIKKKKYKYDKIEKNYLETLNNKIYKYDRKNIKVEESKFRIRNSASAIPHPWMWII